MRDREHDRWIPWYVDDTPGWVSLSLSARGAAEGIARKVNPRTGRLYLRKGLASLSVLLHASWDELEPALSELLAAGRLVWNGSEFYLEDPDHAERQRKTSRDRVAAHRARKTAGIEQPPGDEIKEEIRSEETRGNVTSVTSCNGSNVTSVTSTVPGIIPDWWQGVIDTIEANVGERIAPAEAWLRYDGHRANKGMAPNQRDALYWLTTVMVPEVRESRRRDARDGERTAAYVQQRSGPEVKPLPDSSKRVREIREWERTAATPEQAAKAAADIERLFGAKVGT